MRCEQCGLDLPEGDFSSPDIMLCKDCSVKIQLENSSKKSMATHSNDTSVKIDSDLHPQINNFKQLSEDALCLMSAEVLRLNVSKSWKQKFLLIEKAGGPDLPLLKDLEFSERLGLNFNIIAFILGPFYYVVKGLWRQALVYLLLTVTIGFILVVFGFQELAKMVGYFFGAIYAIRANISYYKRIVLNQKPWF